MPNRCLGNSECRQYCQVLNSLTDQEALDPCQWPDRLGGGAGFGDTSNPELAEKAASQLARALSHGNRLQELLQDKNSELAVAYRVLQGTADARMALWSSYAAAAQQDRVVTDVEVSHYTEQVEQNLSEAALSLRNSGVSDETLTQARAIHDRETLEDHGLLFDEGMVQTITELCANAAAGRSTLLIGDKGIAKTQAAKFVSGLFSPDGKPKFISGDGSMMKDEFIGKMTLTEQNGASVTTFQHGILTECMQQGIPLVMDEINLIDPAIVMRLQDILLRKPGDIVHIQEDGGESIVIKHGFCVMATANEASTRYQSRSALDPAFRDRFVVLPLEYPDGDTTMLQANDRPASLARLAFAFAVSRNGIANPRVKPADALWLASVAHASQQLYSKPARDVQTGRLGTNLASVVDDSEPRMSDCITPRKMVDLVRTIGSGLNPYDVAAGIRGLTLDTIASMQHAEDRDTMFEVVRLMHEGPDSEFDTNSIKKRLRV